MHVCVCAQVDVCLCVQAGSVFPSRCVCVCVSCHSSVEVCELCMLKWLKCVCVCVDMSVLTCVLT